LLVLSPISRRVERCGTIRLSAVDMGKPATDLLLAAPVDPLGQLFAESDEVQAGLGLLERSPPLWGNLDEWRELVVRLRQFEIPWGGRARLAGGSMLYGLDAIAPRARVGRMGAAFLMCRHQVIDVDGKAITAVTRTAARLRVYRGEPDHSAVPAWDICVDASRHGTR
jgi:hypothetical protein